MRRLRGCVVISAIAGAVLGVLLLIVLFATGEMRFSYDAQVTQFFTCQGRDPSTGMPKQPITTFPVGVDQIYICGYLKTSSWVRLAFLVFSNDRIVHTIYDEKFEQGYFVEPLCSKSPCAFGLGLYRVEAERARSTLGSTEFWMTAEQP